MAAVGVIAGRPSAAGWPHCPGGRAAAVAVPAGRGAGAGKATAGCPGLVGDAGGRRRCSQAAARRLLGLAVT